MSKDPHAVLGVPKGSPAPLVRSQASTLSGFASLHNFRATTRVEEIRQAEQAALCRESTPCSPDSSPDVRLDVDVPFCEALDAGCSLVSYMRRTHCTSCPSSSCTECGGGGRVPGEIIRMALGSNVCPRCMGLGRVSSAPGCPSCGGSSIKFEPTNLVVPLSLDDLCCDAKTTVLKGQGHCGSCATTPGDLYLTVRIVGRPRKVRHAAGRLIVPVERGVGSYVLGGVATIALCGRVMDVSFPPMSCSVESAYEGSTPIRLEVRTKLTFPSHMGSEERAAFETLKRIEEEKHHG